MFDMSTSKGTASCSFKIIATYNDSYMEVEVSHHGFRDRVVIITEQEGFNLDDYGKINEEVGKESYHWLNFLTAIAINRALKEHLMKFYMAINVKLLHVGQS
ncbi:hypothetical protein EPI10_023982 [Gossypium australe]|uniref:Uncharacterized protein n=1 Tax=Gossypium australe TaxID=47621 RepID=A0A5B6VXK0_9ROSI|nr:hypothetical protein EPI10_023982 [Gossypium australe]